MSTEIRWHREADGTYTAETGSRSNPATTFGGTDFSATIEKNESGWQVTTRTFGLVLEVRSKKTLAEAKTEAERVFVAVDV